MKIISYIRVSTKHQKDSELGLKAQRDSIKAYAASNGHSIIEEYEEVESAGNKDKISHGKDINLYTLLSKRPILLNAIETAKKTGAVIAIKEITRLTRFSLLFNYLIATGVKFICIDYPNDNQMMLGFRVQFGEEELKQISIRTKAGLAKSTKPRGYKAAQNRLKIDHKKRVKILKQRANDNPNNIRAKSMICPLIEKGLTFQQVADHLNEHQFKSARGCKFYPTSVKLLYEKYC